MVAAMSNPASMRPLLARSTNAILSPKIIQRSITSSARTLIGKRPRAQATQNLWRSYGRAHSRTYADQTISPETKTAVKKGGFRTLRWLWRLTQLSAVGGTIYLGYSIYIGTTPAEQLEPDPNKKTLVVLGESRTAR